MWEVLQSVSSMLRMSNDSTYSWPMKAHLIFLCLEGMIYTQKQSKLNHFCMLKTRLQTRLKTRLQTRQLTLSNINVSCRVCSRVCSRVCRRVCSRQIKCEPPAKIYQYVWTFSLSLKGTCSCLLIDNILMNDVDVVVEHTCCLFAHW